MAFRDRLCGAHIAGLLAVLSLAGALSAQDKISLAVMTLKNASGITQGEAELITDRLGVELFNTGKVNVMERNQMQEILKEQGFQASGTCTDEACLVEMGQMLGVKTLVSGSIGKLGSMYLVNLRMIDVTTAQITQVVSEDISGGIEQVVGRLKGIANQLVGLPAHGAAEPPRKVRRVEAEPEPEPTPEPEVTPEPSDEPPPPVVQEEPPKLTEPEPPQDKWRNRSGIRLSGAFSLGSPDLENALLFDSYSGMWIPSDGDAWDDLREEFEREGHDIDETERFVRLQINNIIKAGRFVTIDVGAGVLLARDHHIYKYDGYNSALGYNMTEEFDWEFRATSPYVIVGLNFVPRVKILKFNIGMLLDVNFNIMRYEFYYYWDNWSTPGSTEWRQSDGDFGVNVSFAPRVGFELFAGPHVGFGLDVLYLVNTMRADISAGFEYEDWKYRTPGFTLVPSLNLYW